MEWFVLHGDEEASPKWRSSHVIILSFGEDFT